VADPRRITRDMLHRPIDVHVNGTPLNLKNAKVIADEKALEFSSNPILLAWFEKKTGRHSPNIVYGAQEKPSWLVYAQFRGGSISVNINNEEYVFIYRSGDHTPYQLP
jgi:hypothetical protein